MNIEYRFSDSKVGHCSDQLIYMFFLAENAEDYGLNYEFSVELSFEYQI